MERRSRNKNAGGLGVTVRGEEVDFYYDLRLARRWKRRGIACGNFGINASRDKALKKTVHRSNGNNDALAEVVTIDSDDEQLLDDKELIVNVGVGVGTDGNDDGDVFDPQYMMFLANLKEDGKSYLLELALFNETPVVVKYEKGDDSNSEVDEDKLESVKCHQKQEKIITEDALKSLSRRKMIDPLRLTLRSHSGREKTENSKRVLRSNLGRERSKSPRRVLRSQSQRKNNDNPSVRNDAVKKVKTAIPRILKSNSRRENYKSSSNGGGCSSERVYQCNLEVYSDVDESYREFLKLAEEDSYLVWRPEAGKTVIYAKSDSDSEAEKEVEGPVSYAENGYPRKRHIPEAANTKPRFNHGEKCDLVDESHQEFLKSLNEVEHCDSEMEAAEEVEDPVSPAENSTLRITHCPNHVAKSHLMEESYLEFFKFVKDGRHMEWTPVVGKRVIYEESDSDSEAGQEAEDPASSENGYLSKSQSPEAANSAKHQCNDRVMSSLEDENYQDFMKFVKNGQNLEYIPDGGEKVTYEESDSDSEVLILDNNLFSDGNPTSVICVDLDGEECVENHSGCKESVFRVELMEILRRPYDILEYEKLWQDASYKSPLQRVRVLRKRDKSYPLPYNCKSYLEVYSDLASVINHAQPDKLRILNLLRGFFYWLQNLAREGSFKPWLDSSCLSALPPVLLKSSSSS